MQPISAAFAAALEAGTFQQVFQATVMGQQTPGNAATFQQLLPPSGNGPDGKPYQIDILAGSLALDTTQPTWRTVSLTLVDRWGWLTPQSATSYLTPFGNEIWISGGIQYPDGTQELIPMGKFTITSVQPSFTGNNVTIAVQGSDRAYRTGLSLLENPVTFNTGTTVAAAVQSLIGSLIPNGGQLVISPAAYAATLTNTTYNQGDNPFTDAQALAVNAGMILYFDVMGNCQLAPAPVPSSQPISWPYGTVGTSGSLIQQVTPIFTQTGSNGPIANTFYMVYEGTTTTTTTNTPVVGVAQDTNPNSPMNANGPYGVVSQFLYTAVAQGQLAANTAAQQALTLSEGEAYGLSIQALPNPAIDGYDVFTAVAPKVFVNGTYVLQSATTSLSPGGSQSLVLLGVPA